VLTKNLRVYELARELGVRSKEVLETLQEKMNIDVSNHMSTINDQVAARVREIFLAPQEAVPEEESDAPARGGGEEARAEAGRSEAPVEAAPQAAEEAEAPPPEGTESVPSRIPVRRRTPRDEEQETRERRRGRRGDPRRRTRVAVEQISIDGPLMVKDLADKLGLGPAELISHLIGRGVMANINQELDFDTARSIAADFGVECHYEELASIGEEHYLHQFIEAADEGRTQPRWPVVTVLGHVDHGKTTLLDTIRHTRVTEQEAGGITQHIGAASVKVDGRSVVFLDTPGHEAFTAMRARGASVTDIAVLVVAADDGVMPQTIEAINHARAAGVPVIVAINKTDLPKANPDRVKQQLSEHGLVPEEWGGDTICVEISALQGSGIDDLLEMILLVTEIQEIKADPTKRAHGTIIEARIDRSRGPVATVLIQGGTLHRGDAFVAGIHHGRVRAMMDESGKQLKEAPPSTPVEVLGLSHVPQAGDPFVVVQDDKTARQISEELKEEYRERELRSRGPVTLDAFYERSRDQKDPDLRLIVKVDVHGSLEAVRGALERIDTGDNRVLVLHGGVGAITKNDVMLASASDAVIVGFNVRPDSGAARESEEQGVEIRTYRVIYELIDDIEGALRGLLAPRYQEAVIGRAEVRATFRVPGAGTVAGLYVTEGRIARNATARLMRDGAIVHEGKISSLKRFQDDVREVNSGYECGLGLENYNDIKVGDELEVYVMREVERG